MKKLVVLAMVSLFSLNSFAFCEKDAESAAVEYVATLLQIEEKEVEASLLETSFSETYGYGSYVFELVVAETSFELDVQMISYVESDDQNPVCEVDGIIEL